MKKKFFIIAFLCSTISLIGLIGSSAHALSGWDAGRIIDDAIFTSANTMNTSQIQSFLESKAPSCDTSGTKSASEFGRPDLTHAQYAASQGWAGPPYTCLKDYSVNGLSAAQMISNVSQQYQINPQVLIVLLQKEQGLVTDTWPLSGQYRTATGYGCPDTAPCDSQYYGLGNQLQWSGKMFRAILNNSPSWYTPYILGNNFIQYSPTSSCGGSNVNIQNRATQALYNYTPYQPNQAALNAGYGTVSCGAYGNRNFFLYFRDWFGPTTGVSYSWEISSSGIYSDSARTQRIDQEGGFYTTPGQKVYARLKAHNTGISVWSNTSMKLGSTSTNPILRDSSWIYTDRATFPTESATGYDGVATFDFQITVPLTIGNYSQSYGLVIDGLTWLSGPTFNVMAKIVEPGPSSPASSAANTLPNGAMLTPGQTILSSNGNSALRFENGRVAFYSNLRQVWTTGAAVAGAARFLNQTDGNLVLYGPNNQVIWASNTNSTGSPALRVQADGNLVLYNNATPLWSTNSSSPTPDTLQVNDMIGYNGALFSGQVAQSLDRKYKLILQADGNLVLYGQNNVLWASGTDGKGGDHLVLQADGNMVLYNTQNKPLWATNSDGKGTSVLIVQTDGNLVLYNPQGVSWATGTSGRL